MNIALWYIDPLWERNGTEHLPAPHCATDCREKSPPRNRSSAEHAAGFQKRDEPIDALFCGNFVGG